MLGTVCTAHETSIYSDFRTGLDFAHCGVRTKMIRVGSIFVMTNSGYGNEDDIFLNPSNIVWRSYGALFARNLKLLRGFRGLSQDELAQRSHMSRNAISNMERNEGNVGRPADPMLSTIYRLSVALRVPPAGLIPNVDFFVERIATDHGIGMNGLWPLAPEGIRRFDRNHPSGAGLILGDSSDFIQRFMPMHAWDLRNEEIDRLTDMIERRRKANNPEQGQNDPRNYPRFDPRFGPETF